MAKSFFKELKDSDIGISNHIALVLLTLFFIVVSKKLNLDVGFFSLIYWYVACLLVGHYSAHNIKPTKKFKYIKGKNDTFVALPFVGLVNMITYGIPILIIDYFFNIY
jgi:hypothetical protein